VGFTGLDYQLQTLARVLGDAAPPKALRLLTDARSMVTHSRNEVRRSVWHIRAQSLHDTKPETALQAMAEEAMRFGSARVEIDVAGKLPAVTDTVKECLLRVAQEGIINAIAHGHATVIQVKLSLNGDKLSMTVADNGEGMNPDATTEGVHFGIVGIRERIEKVSGTLALQSDAGKGTTLQITIPLQRRSGWFNRLVKGRHP
jgi:signal transduction histidine kinase